MNTLLFQLLYISGLSLVYSLAPQLCLFRDRIRLETIRNDLAELKSEKLIRKWNSTNLEINTQTSSMDVQLIARSSFPNIKNYYNELITGASKARKKSSPFIELFPAFCAISFITGGVAVPTLSIPQGAKNALGLISLSLPFIALIGGQLLPGLTAAPTPFSSLSKQRIAVHEAGHFLCAYLCGVGMLSYNIAGDTDSGSQIETADGTTANLLVIAVGGMVAESLVFDSNSSTRNGEEGSYPIGYSGAADISAAMAILYSSRLPTLAKSTEREAALCWAVQKALVLLRLNMSELLLCAELMREGVEVQDLIVAVERGATSE